MWSRTAARRSRRWTSTPSSPAQPEVALVDELAHTNVPGSRNEKRWQDVEEILAAGIDVISTVNVQHLESMNDVVEEITGIKQRETIPDSVVRAADQIEIVDMTPQALRRRMAHGNIYPAEKVDASLANYFREGNLGALRELALMWVADRVDEALAVYRETHGIARPWETRERVVVAITGAPGGDDVIRRAARMAARARSQLLGVHVRSADGLRGPSGDALGGAARRSCRSSGGEYHELASADPAATLVQFARLGERDPDRAGRQPPVALDAPAARFGDHQRAPSVGRHRRPRDLVRPRARRRRA